MHEGTEDCCLHDQSPCILQYPTFVSRAQWQKTFKPLTRGIWLDIARSSSLLVPSYHPLFWCRYWDRDDCVLGGRTFSARVMAKAYTTTKTAKHNTSRDHGYNTFNISSRPLSAISTPSRERDSHL